MKKSINLLRRQSDAYQNWSTDCSLSPHYGERWGRWWLDAARYADTNGFEKDRSRSIWPYRDWVINAFNKDLPFDQFTIEQLAGDLLPQTTLDHRVATGFLAQLDAQSGGRQSIPKQFRVEGIIDRVDAIGKAFLGLTIGCAQCHTTNSTRSRNRSTTASMLFSNNDDEPEIEVPDEKITDETQRDRQTASPRSKTT